MTEISPPRLLDDEHFYNLASPRSYEILLYLSYFKRHYLSKKARLLSLLVAANLFEIVRVVVTATDTIDLPFIPIMQIAVVGPKIIVNERVGDRLKMVRLLLELGIPPNQLIKLLFLNQEASFDSSPSSDRTSSLGLLLSGKNFHAVPIKDDDRLRIAALLLEHGANPDIYVESRDEWYTRAITHCASFESAEMVDLIYRHAVKAQEKLADLYLRAAGRAALLKRIEILKLLSGFGWRISLDIGYDDSPFSEERFLLKEWDYPTVLAGHAFSAPASTMLLANTLDDFYRQELDI